MIFKETRISSYFYMYIHTIGTHSKGEEDTLLMWMGLHYPMTKVTSEERTRIGW